MPGLELPTGLLQAAADPEDAPARRAWMTRLPQLVAELAERWELDVGRPFQPGGAAAWVAPARARRSGEPLVVKVGWPHMEAWHEADALRLWAGEGAVRLVDTVAFGATRALLLEACEPGTPLADVLPPLRQDVVLAGLLRRLWITPPAGHPFRSLSSMCHAWAAEFEDRYAAASPADRLDPGLARAGVALFRLLPDTADDPPVLLATDLHAGNVLAAGRQPFLAIDPKPFTGDLSYDVLQHLLNTDRLLTDPAGLIGRVVDLLDLDAGRLRQWLFARCVQESLDHPDLHAVAAQLAP
jgi:streptomycin 6-kinase